MNYKLILYSPLMCYLGNCIRVSCVLSQLTLSVLCPQASDTECPLSSGRDTVFPQAAESVCPLSQADDKIFSVAT